MAAATPITVPVEAEREINAQRGEVVSIAEALTITDQPSYERAASHLTAVKALQVKVGEMFDDLVSAAHKAHKLLTERRAQHTNPLLAAERTLKSKMAMYVGEQERLERQRQAAAAAKAREEEDARRLEEAAALEQAGEQDAALAVLDAPVMAPPPALVVAPPKATGVSTREVWHGEVTDLMAVAKAVVDGKAPISFLAPATSQVLQWARSTRGTMQIPGVRVWSTTEIAARAR